MCQVKNEIYFAQIINKILTSMEALILLQNDQKPAFRSIVNITVRFGYQHTG